MDLQAAGPNNIAENYNPDNTKYQFVTTPIQNRLNDWYWNKMYLYDNSIIDDDEQEDLIKTITDAIMQYGIKVILIDNLMTALDLDAEEESNKFEKQSKFVNKLRKLAYKFNIIIMLVAHRRKSSMTTDVNDEVSGSGDITNMATVVVSYDRDKELDQSQRRLVLSKSRIVGKLNYEGYILQYDEKSKRIFSNADELHRKFGWEKSLEAENDGFIDAGEIVFV